MQPPALVMYRDGIAGLAACMAIAQANPLRNGLNRCVRAIAAAAHWYREIRTLRATMRIHVCRALTLHVTLGYSLASTKRSLCSATALLQGWHNQPLAARSSGKMQSSGSQTFWT